MEKAIDYVAVRAAFAVTAFIWALYLTEKLLYAALIAVGLTLIFCLSLSAIKKARGGRKRYTAEKLDRRLSLLGSSYVIELFRNAFYPNSVIINEKYFAAEGGLYLSDYKFSNAGQEDVAAAYRLCKTTGVNGVTILCRQADRAATALASSLEIDVHFMTAKKLFKALKKSYSLPDLPTAEKKTVRLAGSLADLIFNKANVRYYLLTGLTLAFMYLFVPLKNYYLALSTTSLLLAFVSAVRKG